MYIHAVEWWPLAAVWVLVSVDERYRTRSFSPSPRVRVTCCSCQRHLVTVFVCRLTSGPGVQGGGCTHHGGDKRYGNEISRPSSGLFITRSSDSGGGVRFHTPIVATPSDGRGHGRYYSFRWSPAAIEWQRSLASGWMIISKRPMLAMSECGSAGMASWTIVREHSRPAWGRPDRVYSSSFATIQGSIGRRDTGQQVNRHPFWIYDDI